MTNDELVEIVHEVRNFKDKNEVVIFGVNRKYNSILICHNYSTGKILNEQYRNIDCPWNHDAHVHKVVYDDGVSQQIETGGMKIYKL